MAIVYAERMRVRKRLCVCVITHCSTVFYSYIKQASKIRAQILHLIYFFLLPCIALFHSAPFTAHFYLLLDARSLACLFARFGRSVCNTQVTLYAQHRAQNVSIIEYITQIFPYYSRHEICSYVSGAAETLLKMRLIQNEKL